MTGHSVNRGDHWELSFYLTFNSYGNVRLTRGQPGLDSNERAMHVTVTVPHSLFKVPQLGATINIAGRETPPFSLDLDAIESALSEAVGAKVEITIKEPENA